MKSSISGFQSESLRSICREVGLLFRRESDGGMTATRVGPGVVGGVVKVSETGERTSAGDWDMVA